MIRYLMQPPQCVRSSPTAVVEFGKCIEATVVRWKASAVVQTLVLSVSLSDE